MCRACYKSVLVTFEQRMNNDLRLKCPVHRCPARSLFVHRRPERAHDVPPNEGRPLARRRTRRSFLLTRARRCADSASITNGPSSRRTAQLCGLARSVPATKRLRPPPQRLHAQLDPSRKRTLQTPYFSRHLEMADRNEQSGTSN